MPFDVLNILVQIWRTHNRFDTFGIRMRGVRVAGQRQGFRDQLAEAGERDSILRTIADGMIAVNATLCQAEADLDRAVKEKAEAHPVAKRLMSIPGVGPVVSLSFVALIDDPERFRKTSDVGAFFGLTPRRYQSGDVDWSGRISKCGDKALRSLLVEAASSLIARVKRFSALRSWAVRLAGPRLPESLPHDRLSEAKGRVTVTGLVITRQRPGAPPRA